MRTLQVNNAIANFKQQERLANTLNILDELKEHDDGRAIGTMAKEAQRFGVPDFLEKKRLREVILEWSKAARLNSDEVMAHLDKTTAGSDGTDYYVSGFVQLRNHCVEAVRGQAVRL